MIDTRNKTERVILAGVCTFSMEDTKYLLDELSELSETAGAETVGRLIQSREQAHPTTYLGKGKIEELKDLLWETEATGVICDDELSPVQMKNLQDMRGVRLWEQRRRWVRDCKDAYE